MYRKYRQQLLLEKTGHTPTFVKPEVEIKLPVADEHLKMEQGKVDMLSILRDELCYESGGASHVFVVMGASVSYMV